jgi:hypothetical protein
MIKAAHDFFHEHPICTGIAGTLASWISSAAAFFNAATVMFGFVAAAFGAGTAVYTFLLVRRRYRRNGSEG